MTVLGLDYGEVTIGVAISELGYLAQPAQPIKRRSWEKDMAALQQMLTSYGVEKIVVGMPLNMNGTVGPAAERVRQFISRLERRFKLPVVAVDERLSTVEAEEILMARGIRREKRKQLIDSLAAAVILQQYLDAQRNR